jgi:hypothetical protein
LPSRKVVPLPIGGLAGPDSIEAWAGRYLDAAVRGVRSAEVTDKIAYHRSRRQLVVLYPPSRPLSACTTVWPCH